MLTVERKKTPKKIYVTDSTKVSTKFVKVSTICILLALWIGHKFETLENGRQGWMIDHILSAADELRNNNANVQWAAVVAQLVERSLPIPEVRGSNPVIGKKFILNILLSTVLKGRK